MGKIITYTAYDEQTIQIDTDNIFYVFNSKIITNKEKNELTDLLLSTVFEAQKVFNSTFRFNIDKLWEKAIKVAEKSPSTVDSEPFFLMLGQSMVPKEFTPKDVENYRKFTDDYFNSTDFSKKYSPKQLFMRQQIITDYTSIVLHNVLRNPQTTIEQKNEFAEKLLIQIVDKKPPIFYLLSIKSVIAVECSKFDCCELANKIVDETLPQIEKTIHENNCKVPFPMLNNLQRATLNLYLKDLAKLDFNDNKTQQKLKKHIFNILLATGIMDKLNNEKNLGFTSEREENYFCYAKAVNATFIDRYHFSPVEKILEKPSILDVSSNTAIMPYYGAKTDYNVYSGYDIIITDPTALETMGVCVENEKINLNLTEQDIASICSIPEWIQTTSKYISLEKMDYSPMLNPINAVIENKLKELYKIYTKEYIPYLIENKETKIAGKIYTSDLLREYQEALGSEKNLSIGQFCKKITGQDGKIADSEKLEQFKNSLNLFVEFIGGHDGITIGFVSHLIEYATKTQGFRNISSHSSYLNKEAFESALNIGLLSDFSIIKNASQILNGSKIQSLKEARQQQIREMKKRIGEERRKKAELEMGKRKSLENIVEPAVQENEEKAETNVVTKSSQKTDEGFSPYGE